MRRRRVVEEEGRGGEELVNRRGEEVKSCSTSRILTTRCFRSALSAGFLIKLETEK